jgi:hypothetical protein
MKFHFSRIVFAAEHLCLVRMLHLGGCSAALWACWSDLANQGWVTELPGEGRGGRVSIMSGNMWDHLGMVVQG